MNKPSCKLIVVISGKRKTGKDYVTEKIIEYFGINTCHVMKVASPIKKHFCKKYNMDYSEMATSSSYKETIREEMILWGEEQRKKDAHVFCKLECSDAILSNKCIWILSDARRQSDIEYFQAFTYSRNINFHSVRVTASMETRKQRGWIYTDGVDNVASECGLDTYNNFDFAFSNSDGENVLDAILQFCKSVSVN